MDAVLALHSHLPWVLHHGRWPHGSDWLSEAALHTYLPLIEMLGALEHAGVATPVTLGVTPILANQLAHPSFPDEMEHFLAERIAGCARAIERFPGTADASLLPLVHYWHERLHRLRRLFRHHDGDLITPLRGFAERGRLELMSSGATHGFLPLLACDESIRFQLRLGQREHVRLFGAPAAGCWVPECAYRPSGPWAPHPDAPARLFRHGIEVYLREAGFRWFFTDSHMAAAGRTLSRYGEDGLIEGDLLPPELRKRSPYQAYDIAPAAGAAPVTAFVRDPRATLRVWSRHEGFPGDGAYLEFHKIHDVTGLNLWRVTSTTTDLGDKLPYDKDIARARAHRDATTLADLLATIKSVEGPSGGAVVAAPFDTELFGHWWYEGIDFLGDFFRAMEGSTVSAVTASAHLARPGARSAIALAPGSWGANGDWSKWLNPGTEWTWKRLWPLERRFWEVARATIGIAAARPALAQAARELLLLQSSDWQFVISTGAAADYAEKRFTGHADRLDALLTALGTSLWEAATMLAAEAAVEDDPFPDVLTVLEEVLQVREERAS